MALTKIKTGGITDNAITNAKMADDAIDSSDYADGSIDNVHLAGSIAVSKTLLSAGTGLTLSTNSLAVDAAQTQITSVGDLTALTVVGNITMDKDGQAILKVESNDDAAELRLRSYYSGSARQWSLFSDNASDAFLISDGTTRFTLTDTSATFAGTITANTGSKITSSSADTTFSIETTSGTSIFPILDFVSSHSSVGGKIRQDGSDVISFDNSQNTTFAGNVRIEGSSATRYLFFNSGDNCGVWNESNTSLRFGTNDTERIEIKGSGHVEIDGDLKLMSGHKLEFEDSASGGGIDDYEEGTYSWKLYTSNGTSSNAEWQSRSGYQLAQYIKIGDVVTVSGRWEVDAQANASTSSDYYVFLTVPFVAKGHGSHQPYSSVGAGTFNRASTGDSDGELKSAKPIIFQGDQYLHWQMAGGTSASESYIKGFSDSNFEGHFCITYRTA